jgi:hypothetical protein
MVSVGAAFNGLAVANNVIVGPGAAVAYDTPSTPMISRIDVLGPNPLFATPAAAGFVSPSPSAADDFMLLPGSPAIGQGDAAYKSFWDHSGAQRTFAAPAAGAWESTGPPDPLPPDRPRNLRVR